MMIENEFNRLTRWGIPGWVAILAFFAFTLVDILFSKGQTRLFNGMSALVSSMNEISSVFTGLLITAAGVPLGFVIYQSYFFVRWTSPFSRDGLAPPFIVGRKEDLERTIRDFTADELTQGKDWRVNWVNHPLYQRDHGWKWRYIEQIVTEASQRIDSTFKGFSLSSRHRGILEIMHTLGASLIAVYFGMIFYILLKMYRENLFLPGHMIGVIIPLVFLVYLLDREDKAKKDLEKPYNNPVTSPIEDPVPAFTFKVKQWLLAGKGISISLVHPSSLFLIWIALTHFFCNPSLMNTSPAWAEYPFKLGISIFVIFAWFWSKRKCSSEIVLGEIVFLAIGLLISNGLYLLPSALLYRFDWPYLTSSAIFLFANLVLLKNRQNARDDLLAMEYYTLRRYLTEKQHLEVQDKREK